MRVPRSNSDTRMLARGYGDLYLTTLEVFDNAGSRGNLQSNRRRGCRLVRDLVRVQQVIRIEELNPFALGVLPAIIARERGIAEAHIKYFVTYRRVFERLRGDCNAVIRRLVVDNDEFEQRVIIRLRQHRLQRFSDPRLGIVQWNDDAGGGEGGIDGSSIFVTAPNTLQARAFFPSVPATNRVPPDTSSTLSSIRLFH